MSEHVITRRDGPVLNIVNDNPGARNALTAGYVQGLIAALGEAERDPSVAAVVLSGSGGFFCAGGDLNVLITRREMSLEERVASIGGLHGAIGAIRDCAKPVIAAVEGGAAGAGASIALACDLIVAEAGAYFAVSYLRVGLTPDGGATAFLSEFAPRQLVNEILFFGDKVAVERLHALGAVNRVVAPGGVLGEAQALGERLQAVAPGALGVAKSLAQAARTNGLAAQLDLEAYHMANAQGGDEAAEGISAFLEKRKPDFTRFRR